jgi:hypothetical protein
MTQEQGNGTERFGLKVGTGITETGGHHTRFQVEKWDHEQIHWLRIRDYDRSRILQPGQEPVARHFREYHCLPFEVFTEEDCNYVLDAGWQMMMNGIAGAVVTKFANGSVGRIGGGTSNTGAAYTQTDLQAAANASNRQWEVINAVPTVGATHTAGLVFAAQFPTTDGNFAWAEFGVDSGTTAGSGASVAPMLSRGVASPGTKTAAQTWNATVTITWT